MPRARAGRGRSGAGRRRRRRRLELRAVRPMKTALVVGGQNEEEEGVERERGIEEIETIGETEREPSTKTPSEPSKRPRGARRELRGAWREMTRDTNLTTKVRGK